MHELALMESLVDAVAAKLADVKSERALGIKLAVGKRAGVSADALRFCFEVCAAGTGAEGAALVLEERDGDELCVVELEVS